MNETPVLSHEMTEFCQRFVVALLHSLWQGVVLGTFAIAGHQLWRHRSADSRYRLWFCALAGLPVCFAITLCSIDVGESPTSTSETVRRAEFPEAGVEMLLGGAASIAPALEDAPQPSEPPISSAAIPPSPKADDSFAISDAAPLILVIYGLGVIGFVLRLMIGGWGGHRLRSSAAPVTDAAILEIAGRRARDLGLRLAPAIVWCDRVAVPTVVGLVKPAILLPPALMSGLSPAHLSAILSHELAHIRRYDPIMNLVQRLIESIFFFHPVVWFISRRVSAERETSCDDLALANGMKQWDYAGALLTMAERCAANRQHPGAALGLLGDRPTELADRIERLIQDSKPPGLRFGRGGVAVLLLALTLGTLIPVLQIRAAGQVGDGEASESEPGDEPAGTTKPGAEAKPRPNDGEANPISTTKPAVIQDLAGAVNAINEQVREIPAARSIKPLTVTDVLDAIRHLDEKTIGDGPTQLTQREYDLLQGVLESKRFPDGFGLRNFARRCDGHTMKHGSWVRLLIQRESRGPFSLAVRAEVVFERPLSQIERQERDSHRTLLGRLITYFAEDPKWGESPALTADYEALVTASRKAFAAKDLPALTKLLFFDGIDGNPSSHRFQQGELKALLEREIKNVSFERKRFLGTPVHWMTLRTYGPEVPVKATCESNSPTANRMSRRRFVGSWARRKAMQAW